MTKIYICRSCQEPCFLVVDDTAGKPDTCPYNDQYTGKWERMVRTYNERLDDIKEMIKV